MGFSRPLLRASLAVLGLTLVGLSAGCHKGGGGGNAAPTTATVTGKVTFTRIPVVRDVTGHPTGLETDSTKFLTGRAARGVLVRFYEPITQTAADGSSQVIWRLANETGTASDGSYLVTLDLGHAYMAEVVSASPSEPQTTVVADTIQSTTPVLKRPVYGFRKALDGTLPPDTYVPKDANHPQEIQTAVASNLAGNVTLNFDIGPTDRWWRSVETLQREFIPASPTHPSPSTDKVARLMPTSNREVTPTGSAPLGILDSAYTLYLVTGGVTPGASQDFHYLPGTDDPRGSYLDFDRDAYKPYNVDVDRQVAHFFGALRGGSKNDAWDETVLLRLLARGNAYAELGSDRSQVGTERLLPAGRLNHLSPELALMEGLADGLTADILKTPYLTQLNGSGFAVDDLTTVPAGGSQYSAPAIAALGWQVILKANSLDASSTPADWTAKINYAAAQRFFSVHLPTLPSTDSTGTADIPNVYLQLAALQGAKSTGEPVDLAAIFTNAALPAFVSPYGLTWPRPSVTVAQHPSGAQSVAFDTVRDWGQDPNTADATKTPSQAPFQFAFSMADAVQVNGSYPNVTEGEVAYARLSLTKDTLYQVTLTLGGAALPSDARIELLFPSSNQRFLFAANGETQNVALPGGNASTAIYQMVRIRLVSPTTPIAGTVNAQLALVPQN